MKTNRMLFAPETGTPPAGTAPAGTAPAGTAPAGTAPAGTAPAAPSMSLATAPAAPAVTDWKSTLNVPDEIKGWEGLNNIKDASDAVKQVYNLNKLLGQDKVVVPKADAPQQVKEAFFDRIGRPKTAEEYKIEPAPEIKQVVEGMDMKAMKALFHKAGLTNEQAQVLFNEHIKESVNRRKTATEAQTKALNEEVSRLKQEWGNDIQMNLEIARVAAKKLGGDNVLKVLADAGLDSHPLMLRMFHNIGKAMGEASAVGFKSVGNPYSSPAAAKSEFSRLMSEKDFREALFDANHPNHNMVVEKRRELYAVMHPKQ